MGAGESAELCGACGSKKHINNVSAKQLCKTATERATVRLGTGRNARLFCTSPRLFRRLLAVWLTGLDLLTLGMSCRTNRRFLSAQGMTPLGRMHLALKRMHLSALPGIIRQHRAKMMGGLVLAAATCSDEIPPAWKCDVDVCVDVLKVPAFCATLTATILQIECKFDPTLVLIPPDFDWKRPVAINSHLKFELQRDGISMASIDVFALSHYNIEHFEEVLSHDFTCLQNWYDGRTLHVLDRMAALGRICWWVAQNNASPERAWSRIEKYRSRGFTICMPAGVRNEDDLRRHLLELDHAIARRAAAPDPYSSPY